MNNEISPAVFMLGFAIGMGLIVLHGVSCDSDNVFTYNDSTKVDLVKKGHAHWTTDENGKPKWELIDIEIKDKRGD